jgi:hypothetical protein
MGSGEGPPPLLDGTASVCCGADPMYASAAMDQSGTVAAGAVRPHTTRLRRRRGLWRRFRRTMRHHRWKRAILTGVLIAVAVVGATAASIHLALKPDPPPRGQTD